MKVGLVLSGGLAKGAYQIGALRAIGEYFKPEELECISSSSVGSLNAYAFASNNLDEGAAMWTGLTPGDTDKKLVTKVMRSDYLKGVTIGLSQKKLVNDNLYISLFRLKEMDVVYLDLGNVPEEEMSLYLQASVAMPVFSKAVKINKKKYYDGGTIDNIPVYPLMKFDLDYIICVYFDQYNYSFETPGFDNKIIKITFNDTESKSIWFTKEGTDKMMKDGYDKAKAVLDHVFADGKENVEAVYANIEKLNALHPSKQSRVTVDVAIHNLNKLMKVVSKRQIVD